MPVSIKTSEDIERMRVAGRLASEVLDYIAPFVKVGVTTDELDGLCHDYMVKVQGTPILAHIADAYNAVGIKDITVVRGYKKEAVALPNLAYVDNNEYADTGELDSLLKALKRRKGEGQSVIVSYGDLLTAAAGRIKRPVRNTIDTMREAGLIQ